MTEHEKALADLTRQLEHIAFHTDCAKALLRDIEALKRMEAQKPKE